MKYICKWYEEQFIVTEEDKTKIEKSFNDNVKLVTLSGGKQIDPVGVRGFDAYYELNEWQPLEEFDYGEEHKKMMLERITERKAMFTRYVNNKGKLEQIKKQGLNEKDENKKNKLREEYKRIELEQKEWTDLIAELKKKDTRKTIVREYSPYKSDKGLVYRLLEFNNLKNEVKIISESPTPPKGWEVGKTRYLTV